ncbi:MAG: TIGR00730 family Rossman fold protein [Anaerolineales bacterium]|nr:TIGR00730 family Rossman fold protein [Anaerolineales bacterium]
MLDRVSVYCGSSDGVDPSYLQAAQLTGRTLAQRSVAIVFGGGGTGMMGALADGALAAGGQVLGIIPRRFNNPELAHPGLTELRVVETMHERKAAMAELAQAFIALPGGYGTLEELFEILTWSQIGLHTKPVGLLNVKGYYDPLLTFIQHMLTEGFIYDEHRALLACEAEPEALLQRLEDFRPPEALDRWMHRSAGRSGKPASASSHGR